jgi:aminoglycoside phosphotransferase (APT) family kinase protein
VPPQVRAWVARHTRATITRTRRLAGASSTALHALYLSDGTRFVLRRYLWPGFLEDEPVVPQREVDALRFALSHGRPVPEIVAADVTGDEIGDGVPALLMTLLPGRAVGVPDLVELAKVAASIHSTRPTGFGHDYFPWYRGTTTRAPAASTWPSLWDTATELWHNEMPSYNPTFIHRDFHPGNVLWVRARASGVVDWANACRGPWGCDVAHCRANLIALSSPQAADEFLAAYELLTGGTYHPYWDLASVLEHGPSHWTPERLVESERRLARAVQAMTNTPPRGQ